VPIADGGQHGNVRRTACQHFIKYSLLGPGSDEYKMNPFVGFKAFYRCGKRLNVVGMPHVSGIEYNQLILQAKLHEQLIALPGRRLNLLASAQSGITWMPSQVPVPRVCARCSHMSRPMQKMSSARCKTNWLILCNNL